MTRNVAGAQTNNVAGRRGLRARAWQLLHRLGTERGSPGRLGWAVAIGIVIGTSPFMGFHLLITIVVATLLGLNRVVTYLAANISLPAVAPLLMYGSIQLGTRFLTGEWLPFDRTALLARDPWEFGQAWLCGSLLLGAILGAPAGLFTWWGVHRYRQRHPPPPDPIAEAMDRVVARYRVAGRFAWGYVRGKLQHDPVYRQLAERAPMAEPFVDLGCGRGQLSLLLAELQPGLTGLGVDWDARKTAQAQLAARGTSGLAFQVADTRTFALPPAATLFMIDILHYHERAVQDRMLQAAAAALTPGGRLFVRDVDGGHGWRARVNEWQERIGTWAGLNRGATLCFRPAAEVTALLAAHGLEVSMVPSWADTPLANVLIEARRPG